MVAFMSVVVCSRDGAAGVHRCLLALHEQTIRSGLELIVVDDGSTDSTSDVARADGAIVIRHDRSRGASAARNAGIRAASAPIVAFLDDDCEPDPEWSEKLLAAYDNDTVLAVGGTLLLREPSGILLNYLARNNPLDPQEADLGHSGRIPYRLLLYIRRQWKPPLRTGRRKVYSFPSANMSVRRSALAVVGGFDERIRFGSEDEDLCRRLRQAFPGCCLIFEPQAKAAHHFRRSLRDTLRRSRAYGRGSALMYRKWPGLRLTFFPFPVVMVASVILSFRYPFLVVADLLLPHLFYPRGLRSAIAERDARCLLDAYLHLAQETCDDLGVIEGLWRFRHFVPEPSVGPVQPVKGEARL
jgi:glycosyltransferase involved in cell wall biosynthesis